MEPYQMMEGALADPESGLEESMWQLGLGSPYPERPGEPDCTYYMRTGSCGYGERCRYNHPRDHGVVAGAVRSVVAEYPERVGQPACQYFLRTGTCKYGPTCKYDHPRQGSGSLRPISLNYLGYPLRLGVKECSYYMRTGQCKFGSACKFHHPQPSGASMPSPAPAFYSAMQSSSVPSPHQYPTMDGARPSSMLSASYIQGPYGPMLFSPGVVSVPGWSPYPPISPLLSPGGQHSVQARPMYGPSDQLSSTAPAYPGPYPTISSPAVAFNSMHKDHMFPERPGQPECQYYMRTGDCKFGSTCKYNHPSERNIPETNCVLSPIGLPLRPGAPPCTFYAQHGVCKFGPTCKFDHPMGTLSYSPSASSLADIPVAPYPVGLSMATHLAPSSSSSELRPEFKDAFSAPRPLMMPSEAASSGSIGLMFSKGGYVPHSTSTSSQVLLWEVGLQEQQGSKPLKLMQSQELGL